MSLFTVQNPTGGAGDVTLADLGNVVIPDDNTVYNLFDTSTPGSSSFSRDNLAQSEDLQAAIDAGSLVVAEDGVAFSTGAEFYTAIAILESDITDWAAETDTFDTEQVADSRVAVTSVTQHQAAINAGVSITESQISDLKDYALATDLVGLLDYKGSYDATADSPQLEDRTTGAEPVAKGDVYTVTVAGTFHGVTLEVGDMIIAEVEDADEASEWTVVERNLDDAITSAQLTSIEDLNSFFTSDVLYDWTTPTDTFDTQQIDASRIPTSVTGKLSWSISAADKNTLSSPGDVRDLSRITDVHTNESPFVVPVDCKLVYLAGSNASGGAWTGGFRVDDTEEETITVNGSTHKVSTYTTTIPAGSEIRLRFNSGSNIEKPAMEAFFQAV
jgi:hypothetical protein